MDREGETWKNLVAGLKGSFLTETQDSCKGEPWDLESRINLESRIQKKVVGSLYTV